MNKISKYNSKMIKGIAALLVIIAHYSRRYLSLGNGGIIWMLLMKAGRYGVAIFLPFRGMV